MTGGVAALVALWRHERRTLWRRGHRLRTALQVVLVLLPVMALVAATSIWRTLEPATASPSPSGANDGFEAQVLFLAGGFGALEAGLLVAAAFLLGLQRRRHELGLLGAAGATSGQLLLGHLLSAALVAGGGCVLGVASGLAAAAVVAPWLEVLCGRPVGPLCIAWDHVGPAAALGFVTAMVACLGPAWALSRRPIRRILGARRPDTRSRRWHGAGALSLVSLGIALAFVAPAGAGRGAAVLTLAGTATAALGCVIAGGVMLAVGGRLAVFLPLAWRHSLRSAARQRAVTAPAVSAIAAAIAVGIATSAVAAGVAAVAEHEPQPAGAAAVVASLVLAVAVVLVVVTLSAEETAHERRVLLVVGADHAHLRRHAAAGATWVVVLGALLAVPAGLLPAHGIAALADHRLPFVVPWATLAAVTLAFPAAVHAAVRLWPRSPSLPCR